MASDGIRPPQFPAKHSLNGAWMARAIQATPVVSVLRQAAARMTSRPGRPSRPTGRHTASYLAHPGKP